VSEVDYVGTEMDGGKGTCGVTMLISAWEGKGKGECRNVYIPLNLTGEGRGVSISDGGYFSFLFKRDTKYLEG